MRRSARAPKLTPLVVVAAGVLLGGCAGSSLDTSMLGPTTAALKLPEVPSLPNIELPKMPAPIVGTPTEVYERIGHGAVTCWFGASGPLKGTHIYEASADSPHKGGQAEIAVRERDEAAPVQRGIRAFRVSIRPDGNEKASVEAENLKLPDPLASRLKHNVEAWAAGKTGCEAGVPVEAAAEPAANATTPATAVATPPAASTTAAGKPPAQAQPPATSKTDDKATRATARVATSKPK